MSELTGFNRQAEPNNLIKLCSEYFAARGLTHEMLAPLNGALMPLGPAIIEKIGTAIFGFKEYGVVGAYVFEITPGDFQGRMIFDPDKVGIPKPGEQPGKLPKVKYIKSAGSVNTLFIPPHLGDWFNLENHYDLVIVEGVLNATRLAAEGIRAVAIQGVFNYRVGSKHSPIIPDLIRLIRAPNVDKITVMFDSDAADIESNALVWNANNVFIQDVVKLRDDRGATVYTCNPPARADGSKNGPDDYLHAHGKEAFYEVLSQAQRYDDHPYFKLAIAVLDRFIYDKFAGMVWDCDVSQLLTERHANINMISVGEEYDITSTKPKKVSFDLTRFLKTPGRRIAHGSMYNPSTGEPYFQDEHATPPVWRINRFNPRDVPEAIKGDTSLFWRMLDNICADTPSAKPKILQIVYEHIVRPDLTPKYGIAIMGDRGSGKSTFSRCIGLTLSRRYTDMKVTIGKDGEGFNSLWRGHACKEWSEFDRNMDAEWLKSLITDVTYRENHKYGAEIMARNHTLNIFTSNTLQSKIEKGDRRFIICGMARANDKELGLEFERAVGTMDKPGLLTNHLRYFFLHEYEPGDYDTLDNKTELTNTVVEASQSYRATVCDEILEQLNDIPGLELVFGGVLEAMLAPHRVSVISFVKENMADFIKPAMEVVKVEGTLIRFRAFKNHDKWKIETNGDEYRKQHAIMVKHFSDLMGKDKY